MRARVVFDIDTDRLHNYTDEVIASWWYVAQATPAPIEDQDAGQLAECIGREIIRRWVRRAQIPLWNHQGRHAPACELADMRREQRLAESTAASLAWVARER
jgi:hypothetical protein